MGATPTETRAQLDSNARPRRGDDSAGPERTPTRRSRVFSPNVIAILAGPAFVGIVGLGLAGCRVAPEPPTPSITRIPAPATTYVTPKSTLPVMPTWTYGPNADVVEVAR